jgi:hypothetical protein
MERFRLNIDVKDAGDASEAVNVSLMTIARNPQQKIGNDDIIKVESTVSSWTSYVTN